MKRYMEVLASARAEGKLEPTAKPPPARVKSDTELQEKIRKVQNLALSSRIQEASRKGRLQEVLAQIKRENAQLLAQAEAVKPNKPTKRPTSDYKPPRALTQQEAKDKSLKDKYEKSKMPNYETPFYSKNDSKIKSSGNGL